MRITYSCQDPLPELLLGYSNLDIWYPWVKRHDFATPVVDDGRPVRLSDSELLQGEPVLMLKQSVGQPGYQLTDKQLTRKSPGLDMKSLYTRLPVNSNRM